MLSRKWQKVAKVNDQLLEFTNTDGFLNYLAIDFQSEPKICLYYLATAQADLIALYNLLDNCIDLALPAIHDAQNQSITLHANNKDEMSAFLDVINQYQSFLHNDCHELSQRYLDAFVANGFALTTRNNLSPQLENKKEEISMNKEGNNTKHSYSNIMSTLVSGTKTPNNSPQPERQFPLIDKAIAAILERDSYNSTLPSSIISLGEAQEELRPQTDERSAELSADFFDDTFSLGSDSESEVDAYDEDARLQELLTPEEYQRYQDERVVQEEAPARPGLR